MAWIKRKKPLLIPRPNEKGVVELITPTSFNKIQSKKKNRKKIRGKRRTKRNIVKPSFDIEKNVSRETRENEKEFQTISENEVTPFDMINHDVLQEMQERFNKSQKEREEISERKRRETFENKYGIFGNEYNTLTSVLGSQLFRMLKESMHLDSNQVMDIVHDYNGIANERDIEHALLSLIGKINDEYKENVNMILDAMALGFTLEESEYLLSEDMKKNYEMVKGVSALRDIIEDEIGLNEREKLLDEIWDEYT